ncbi:MAG: nucleotidyltransferase domain-containing protein [Coriobacteriales bacterium]|nr:nucleotidyltransferase domain-containing protein [Coriobacteriales bacterium]
MVDQTDNTTVYTISQLRSIIEPYARERGFFWARLFGSYARGEATGRSDIDVLVDKGPARYLAVCGLADHIYQATGKMVDVIDVSELKPGPFRDAVLREAVQL